MAARSPESFPMYSARIFTVDLLQLSAERDTLPPLVDWCADQLLDFDSAQRVRRELNRSGVFSRGFKLLADSSPCFVLISLVKASL